MCLTSRRTSASALPRALSGLPSLTQWLQFQHQSPNKTAISSDTRLTSLQEYNSIKFGQVHNVRLIPKAKNCDELFFEKQVYWWEPAYMLTEMGEAYCHWAEPMSQSPSNGNWNQKAEKIAHLPLMFTDELSHADPDNGIRVLPYDLSVRLLCN